MNRMKKPLFAARLVRADRVRSYHVRPTTQGWEASAFEDHRVMHDRHYTDWHRVEHTLASFKHEIAGLRADGWRDA